MVHEVARELGGKGVVVQINTEENPRLAERFNIRGIPALLILRSGRVVNSTSGAMDRDSLLAWWKRNAA